MKKSSRATPARADAPQPAQMAALRRLLDDGELPQARRRIRELRRAFPRFKPLLALAWEVEADTGHPMTQAARAWDWHQASPGSEAAANALAIAAQRAGLSALFVHACQKLDALQPTPTMPSLPEGVSGELGPLTFQEAVVLDLSRMHLADGAMQRAVELLRGQTHPSARNNLVLALFSCGEVPAARDLAEQLWQEDPANLFAAELALRLRCWTDGLAAVQGSRDALVAAVPRRPEEVLSRIVALRFLGDDTAAQAAWSEPQPDGFWDRASPEQRDHFDQLGDASAVGVGTVQGWLPQCWIDRLRALGGPATAHPAGELDRRFDDTLRACDAHRDYLRRACESAPDPVPQLALAVLKLRARPQGPGGPVDADIVALLTELLTRMRGSDEARLQLMNWLGEHGLRDPAAPVRLLAQGEVREVVNMTMELHAERSPPRFGPAGSALQERWLLAMKAGDFRGALELALQLCALAPEQAAALVCLAHARQAVAPHDPELLPLMQRAFALDPDYLFARCGLAECLVLAGRVDEAKDLLRPLHEIRRWHFSEYRSFLATQLTMARAADNTDSAKLLLASLNDLAARFG